MKKISLLFLLIVGLLYIGPILSQASGSTLFQLQLGPAVEQTTNSGGGSASSQASQIQPTEAPKDLTTSRIVGRAAPNTSIAILLDGKKLDEVPVDAQATFLYELKDVVAREYVMGLQTIDKKGLASILMNVPIALSSGVSNIVDVGILAPVVTTDKVQVVKNSQITIIGSAVPEEEVVLEVMQSSEEAVLQQHLRKVPDSGEFRLGISLFDVPQGNYTVKAYHAQNPRAFTIASFIIGDKEEIKKPDECLRADLNCDQRVNLTDFSIASFWYKRPLSEKMIEIELERLSGDGVINLVDFSIMAFYWNG